MKQINFKVIIIGLLISWGIFMLIPLIQTILEFMSIRRFQYPLGHYLMGGYLPLVLSGIYIAFSKAKNKIIHGVFVGVLYSITVSLILDIAMPSPYFKSKFSLLSFSYALLKGTLICTIVSWGI
jgi:hypothetical protein